MSQLKKAQLIPKVPDSGVDTIEFMFNPAKLSFSRSINISDPKGARTSTGLPKVAFQYISPYKLMISDIIFDTYEEGSSVLWYINKLRQAVEFPSGKNVPPVYIFTWGEQQYLRCFVEQLNYQLTLFLADGTPVRAIVNLILHEVDVITASATPSAPGNVNREADTRDSRS